MSQSVGEALTLPRKYRRSQTGGCQVEFYKIPSFVALNGLSIMAQCGCAASNTVPATLCSFGTGCIEQNLYFVAVGEIRPTGIERPERCDAASGASGVCEHG